LNVPPLLPPSARLSVPLVTLTVLALLNGTANCVVPAPLLFSVPPAWLLKVSVPATLLMCELFCALKVPLLLKTLLPPLLWISPASLVQVAVPALLMVRPLNNLTPAPLIVRVAPAAIVVVAPPLIVPAVQFNAPLTVMTSAASVPPARANTPRLPTVLAPMTVSVVLGRERVCVCVPLAAPSVRLATLAFTTSIVTV
jgi:hypothetical protein